MALIGLLLLFLIAPLVLAIVGIFFICKADPVQKKKGKYMLLGAMLLLLMEILVGYSVCSNLKLH
jgi:hypothetical protein